MARVPESDLPDNLRIVPEDDLPTNLLQGRAVPVDDLPTTIAAPTPEQQRPVSTGPDPVFEALRPLGLEVPIPFGEVFDPFLIRTGRRTVEAGESLENLPTALADLVTGRDLGLQDVIAGEDQPGFFARRAAPAGETLRGVFSPFESLFAPVAGAIEQAAAPIVGEEHAKLVGDFGEMMVAIATGRLSASGRLSGLGDDLAKLMGVSAKSLAKPSAVIQETDAMRAARIVEKAAKEAEIEDDVLRMFKNPDELFKEQPKLKSKPTEVPTEEELFTSFFVDDAVRQIPPAQADELASIDRMLRQTERTSSFVEDLTRTHLKTRDIERFIKTGKTAKELPKKAKKAKGPDLLPEEETTARMILGTAQERIDAIRRAEGPIKARPPTKVGVLLRGIAQESSRFIARFGAAGKVLARDMVRTGKKGDREAGSAVALVEKSLDGLSSMELDNFVSVLDVGASPITTRVAAAARTVRPVLEDVARRAYQAGITIKNPVTGEVIPFAPRPDGKYFPHYSSLFDFDELLHNPKRLAEATEEIQRNLAKGGKNVSLGEARKTLEAMMKNGQRRFGNLELSRVFNFDDFDRSPVRVLTKYLDGAYKRVNMAETFGADFRHADDLVEAIGIENNSDIARSLADMYVKRITGREKLSAFEEAGRGVGRLVRGAQVWTKLGQAFIANASQPTLTTVVVGMKNTMKALNDVAFKQGGEFSKATGATLASTLDDINRSLGAGRFGGGLLRVTQFSRIERFNRILASNAGRHFALDVFDKYQRALTRGSGRKAERYRRALEKMDINVNEALGRGALSMDDQLKAGQSIVKRTQFTTAVEDLPLFATSELGKVVFQFKTFSFKAAQMLKDDIVLEAGRGNFGPLARALLIMPLSGELVNGAQAFINGKERPEKFAERIAEDYAAVGSIALFWSMALAAGFGPAAVANTAFGPTAGDATNLAANIFQLAKGKPKPIAKQLTRAIPVAGPAIAGRAFPPRQR